ncbi:MAG: TetR/AcrR family transcriptional regulator [Xanthomonadales bacterium]|nr:TetR/AcrR family transcriptional regulator [Xanthomonadales bacterium]
MPESSTKADGKGRRRKEARPAELVDAAFSLFLEKGFAATRIEDVAARAGVGKGTLYLYYQSKEQLLQAAVEQLLLPRFGDLQALIADPDLSAAEQLDRVLGLLWKHASASGLSGLPKLMIGECHNFPALARQFVERWIAPVQDQVLRKILQRGIARGEFSVSDPEYAVRCIAGGFVFLFIWGHSLADFDQRGFDPERQRTAWMEMIRSGLGLAPTTAEEALA